MPNMQKVLDGVKFLPKTFNSGDCSSLKAGKGHKTSHHSTRLLTLPVAHHHSAGPTRSDSTGALAASEAVSSEEVQKGLRCLGLFHTLLLS